MGTELVKASSPGIRTTDGKAMLPELVERAGGAARFAWDEFFYAEHHNPHTQKAYMAAVKRFLAWAEGQGVELAAIRPAWSANTSSAWAARPRSGTCICRRCGAFSTAWCNGMWSCSTRPRR